MLLTLSERINKIPQFPYKKHLHGQSGRLTLASVKISLPSALPPTKKIIGCFLKCLATKKYIKPHKTLRIQMKVRGKWAIKIKRKESLSLKTSFLRPPCSSSQIIWQTVSSVCKVKGWEALVTSKASVLVMENTTLYPLSYFMKYFCLHEWRRTLTLQWANRETHTGGSGGGSWRDPVWSSLLFSC